MNSTKPILLVLMAGNGTRFAAAGYTQPKPLIPFFGKPMIQHVVESIGINGDWVFFVQQDHIDQFNIDVEVKKVVSTAKVFNTKGGVTSGAAASALMALANLPEEDLLTRPLVIINSDNIIDWDGQTQINNFMNSTEHGMIACFTDTDPKWSFARTDKAGFVLEVAEKRPISDKATAGIYIWKTCTLFIDAANQMIEKDIRVNGEFYLAPVYNENILNGNKIVTCKVNAMHGVGTPEDLTKYILSRG